MALHLAITRLISKRLLYANFFCWMPQHGNRLEKLVGDRKGQYSIRINDQWRICFVWTDENNADQVEIVDYH
jgi:plasmid maintenance system killer protein